MRGRGFDRGVVEESFSMPSGHTTFAFALATSWSLSAGRWYVTAPALTWASGVALSRVWLGVHYPSDILVGVLLGGGVGLAAHVTLRELRGEGSGGTASVPFGFIVSF
jgi:membrane-associated phospholipid phosphatase